MSKPEKRSRRSPTIARLPRRGYVIHEKHLRRFRSLALRPDTTYAGLVHMGEDGNEIWVEAGLSEAEKRFTIVHELVHIQVSPLDSGNPQAHEEVVNRIMTALLNHSCPN